MEEGLILFRRAIAEIAANCLIIWIATKIVIKEIKKGLLPYIEEYEQWRKEKGYK